MKRLRRITGWIVCASLGAAVSADADVVTDWKGIAAQSILSGVPTRVGGTAFLDFAMVHLAIHDAIQAYEGRYESYGEPIANATGSPVAAVASAAYEVLVDRFPAQTAT